MGVHCFHSLWWCSDGDVVELLSAASGDEAVLLLLLVLVLVLYKEEDVVVDEEDGDNDKFNMDEATIFVVFEFCLNNLGDKGGEGDAICCCCCFCCAAVG
jgi:hypothetical protein